MTAKVANTAIQDGYQLYHHTFFLTQNQKGAVIQQDMSNQDRYTRRYHWLSSKTLDFVVEPHRAIVGEQKHEYILNMTAKQNQAARKTSMNLAKESPRKLFNLLESAKRPLCQKSLSDWMSKTAYHRRLSHSSLNMPRNINWDTLTRMYEFQPSNYEELLSVKGVGESTVRGLALVAELIFGEESSWQDPVKFSFAFGGKDGVPFPVNHKAMDESIVILKTSVQEAKIGDKEKLRSLKNL
jgi:uncharacterized protein